jgi:hypothetical protein
MEGDLKVLGLDPTAAQAPIHTKNPKSTKRRQNRAHLFTLERGRYLSLLYSRLVRRTLKAEKATHTRAFEF